jgi:hypothetical protein
MAGITRIFNGKPFAFYYTDRKEKEVKDIAKRLRAKGKKARVTHSKNPLRPYWELWVRD